MILPQNAEIASGNHYTSLGILLLLLTDACVGDSEVIKYLQYAIKGISKKSLRSFGMARLTGSTNGHIGVAIYGGDAKWRQKELMILHNH